MSASDKNSDMPFLKKWIFENFQEPFYDAVIHICDLYLWTNAELKKAWGLKYYYLLNFSLLNFNLYQL